MGEWEGWREGGRVGGMEGRRESGREGGRVGGMEGREKTGKEDRKEKAKYIII